MVLNFFFGRPSFSKVIYAFFFSALGDCYAFLVSRVGDIRCLY